MKLSRKTIIITVVLATLLVGAGIYEYQGNKNESPVENPQPTEQSNNQNQTGDPSTTQSQANNQPATKPGVSENTTPNTQPTTDVSVLITNVNGSTDPATVRATVSGATSGKCTLTLEKAGNSSISQSGPLQLAGTVYACPNFNIPKNQFPTKGTWSVKVVFSGQDKQGEATSSMSVE